MLKSSSLNENSDCFLFIMHLAKKKKNGMISCEISQMRKGEKRNEISDYWRIQTHKRD